MTSVGRCPHPAKGTPKKHGVSVFPGGETRTKKPQVSRLYSSGDSSTLLQRQKIIQDDIYDSEKLR